MLSLRIGGESAVVAGGLILTVVILIFSEVAPKTMAALNPPRLALPAAYVYYPLLKITYPVVWALNLLANGILRLLGVRADQIASHSLSTEELKTVVAEAGAMIPRRHQRMLISILDLEKLSVDDVMVPRQEIVGLDLEDDWSEVLQQIQHSRHSRLPVFRDSIDDVIGILNLRTILPDLARDRLTEEVLLARLRDPYFIPEGTPLNKQLLSFQRSAQRLALVVDEYGDIQGLVTMEDILREIVGELGPETNTIGGQVVQETEDTYLVNATVTVRGLNRVMNWNLPTDGPKTLNGLILEQLEKIPEPGTGLTLGDHPVEIVDTGENAIRTVRVRSAGQGTAALV
jgi:Mg2+/Co2+ transporter CorB